MGNVSLTNFEKISVGGANQQYLCDVTMSSSYATSGDTVSATGTPFGTIVDLLILSIPGTAYTIRYNKTASKILAYDWVALTEVSAAVNLSALVCKAILIGKS